MGAGNGGAAEEEEEEEDLVFIGAEEEDAATTTSVDIFECVDLRRNNEAMVVCLLAGKKKVTAFLPHKAHDFTHPHIHAPSPTSACFLLPNTAAMSRLMPHFDTPA